MYVYIWKTPDGIPFYVGMGKNISRPNPKYLGHRNEYCAAKVHEVGVDNVIIELRTVPNAIAAKLLEQTLIAQYGHIFDGSGTLTNRSKGGEFHATTSVTKAKLKKLWEDPKHRDKTISARKSRNLAPSTKETLRQNLAENPAMLGWGERNGKDPEFDAKRIKGIQAAQPKRAEKMRDPVALAQRKERLKATLNSPEYRAKRAAQNTPEYRQKLSDTKRKYWADKKAGI